MVTKGTATQTSTSPNGPQPGTRPNILVLCMDQWQTHMQVPDAVPLPAMRRLEAQGVSFDRQYCTVPMCTPSRATMWTGVHAIHTGLWDNTNFAWTGELTHAIPTIGHMLRDQGYYTAFKGKWHLSEVPHREDGLEHYGFSDYQQWGDTYGGPLEGEQLDGAVTFETVDWLEHRAAKLDRPWLLVCSLINPHDVMFLQTDPSQQPHPEGLAAGMQTTVQQLGWFEQEWDVTLPDNFEDDYALQPQGVRHYKEYVDLNYGNIPDERRDLWRKHRNYLVNCMRLVDAQFNQVIAALDRLHLWDNTVVVFTGDHGEMNGAHRLTQKANIPFEEAAIVNLTVCAPGGPRGQRTAAIGSHLDLAPTLLAFTGLNDEEIQSRYPHLKGRSLKAVMLDPEQDGPRGSPRTPGDGALVCWDALNALDNQWSVSGALKLLTSLGSEPSNEQNEEDEQEDRRARLHEAGRLYGAPDFSQRAHFRAVSDGRHKLVRWFSPQEYANPVTLADLYAGADVALYDLESDPGELENLAHPDHSQHDPALVQHMLDKLHALVRHEIGDDRCPFDLDMFGTREVRHRDEDSAAVTQGGPAA